MKILYFGNFFRMGGYSRAAHDYAAALLAAGADVLPVPIIVPEDGWSALEPRYLPLAERFMAQQANVFEFRPDVSIIHAPPSALGLDLNGWQPAISGRRVAITTWETTPLPDAYAEILRNFDKVIVPSRFCADLMDACDIAASVVPHCYDPDFWDPGECEVVDKKERLTFYTVGAWNDRKNHVGLLKAYLHAFTRADPVRLVISAAGADLRMARSLLARSGIPDREQPEIIILDPDRPLSEIELRQLHADGDVFVSATRGEGFGLGHFEARIMGKFVISPTRTGEQDFLDVPAIEDSVGSTVGLLDAVCRVPARPTPVFPEEQAAELGADGVVRAMIRAPRGTSCKQTWFDPDLVTLAKIMRSVAAGGAHHDPASTIDAMEKRYSYRVVGPQLLRELETA